MELEELRARVTTKSRIERRTRFKEEGDHAYQGRLYDYEGVRFGIELFEYSIQKGYEGIKNLIIGIGQDVSHYRDVADPRLEEQYSQKLAQLEQIIGGIRVGDTIKIYVSRSQFKRNRRASAGATEEWHKWRKFGYWDKEGRFHPIKFKSDPCLWEKDCLLYAPFGYEPLDYGDGRRTVDPEVKDIKVLEHYIF